MRTLLRAFGLALAGWLGVTLPAMAQTSTPKEAEKRPFFNFFKVKATLPKSASSDRTPFLPAPTPQQQLGFHGMPAPGIAAPRPEIQRVSHEIVAGTTTTSVSTNQHAQQQWVSHRNSPHIVAPERCPSPLPGCPPVQVVPVPLTPSPYQPMPQNPSTPAPAPVTPNPEVPVPAPAPTSPPEFNFDSDSLTSGAGFANRTSIPNLGDLLYYSGVRVQRNVIAPGTTNTAPGRLFVPRIAAGSFKIADNESPRPTDRVFVTYNRYENVSTGVGFPTFDVDRETFGFEKTFLDGRASFGMRVPLLQVSDNVRLNNNSGIGDLTFIGKYALIDNRDNGNLLSAGLAATVPTGQSFDFVEFDSPDITLWQPFVGYILNGDRFYLQAFHSLVIPSRGEEITAMFNDVTLGYWVYRDESLQNFLRGVVPTFETHVTTPLEGRDDFGPYGPDIVNLTAGVNFVLRGNSVLGLGVAIPVTGPRPLDVEGIINFNLRF